MARPAQQLREVVKVYRFHDVAIDFQIDSFRQRLVLRGMK